MRTGPSADSQAWQVPQGWRQGRGAWGGLVIGAMLRAVGASSHGPLALRSVSAQICAPVSGSVDLRVQALREGSSMTMWQASVHGAEHLAEAVVITGPDRAVDLDPALTAALVEQVPAPEVDPAWRDCPVTPVQPPLGPEFARHFEYRVLQGLPLTGGAPRTRGWIRDPRDPHWDAVRVLAIVDAWWPCLYASLREPRPMATVDFAAHLVGDPQGARPGEPLLHDAELVALHGGYATERRRLWTISGELLVESIQSLAIIR